MGRIFKAEESNNWCSGNKLSVQNVGDGVEEVSV